MRLATALLVTALACGACNKGGSAKTTPDPRDEQAQAAQNAEQQWNELDHSGSESK